MHIKVNLDGFTPLPDVLAGDEDIGLSAAAVYGAIWRYSYESGLCWASRETIAKRVGVSAKTVSRSIKILLDHGYIRETLPRAEGETYKLEVTGKITLEGQILAKAAEGSGQNVQDEGGSGQNVQGSGQNVQGGLDKMSNKDTSKRESREDVSFESLGSSSESPAPSSGENGRPKSGTPEWKEWMRARVGAGPAEAAIKARQREQESLYQSNHLGDRLLLVWAEAKGWDPLKVPAKKRESLSAELVALRGDLDITDDQAVEVLEKLLDPGNEKYAWYAANPWKTPRSDSLIDAFMTEGLALSSGGNTVYLNPEDRPDHLKRGKTYST